MTKEKPRAMGSPYEMYILWLSVVISANADPRPVKRKTSEETFLLIRQSRRFCCTSQKVVRYVPVSKSDPRYRAWFCTIFGPVSYLVSASPLTICRVLLHFSRYTLTVYITCFRREKDRNLDMLGIISTHLHFAANLDILGLEQ